MKFGCPTCDECSNKTIIHQDGVFKYVAAWYPQMGGYVGRCIIEIPIAENSDSCFDVYVWHDGEFPFNEKDCRGPIIIHHCVADQFIEFGTLVKRLLSEAGGK